MIIPTYCVINDSNMVYIIFNPTALKGEIDYLMFKQIFCCDH